MDQHKIIYNFTYVAQCNMCYSKSDTHKILGKRLNQSQGKNPAKKIGITTTVVKCSNCGLVYANPRPTPLDIHDHYGVSPENYWKENYFRLDDDYFKGELVRLERMMTFKPGMRSLDIGAGLGKGMLALARAGFDTYGVEPSRPFYETAISKMGIHPDRLKLCTIESIDFPENYFDFISFSAVLEHIYDPSQSILSAMQLLKPEGIIHIEVPSSEWLTNKLINLYYKLIGTDYVANISPMHPPYHLYEFNLKSFKEHSRNHNYEIAFHEYYVCRTYLPKFADFILKPYMQRTNTGMQLCVWLRKKA